MLRTTSSAWSRRGRARALYFGEPLLCRAPPLLAGAARSPQTLCSHSTTLPRHHPGSAEPNASGFFCETLCLPERTRSLCSCLLLLSTGGRSCSVPPGLGLWGPNFPSPQRHPHATEHGLPALLPCVPHPDEQTSPVRASAPSPPQLTPTALLPFFPPGIVPQPLGQPSPPHAERSFTSPPPQTQGFATRISAFLGRSTSLAPIFGHGVLQGKPTLTTHHLHHLAHSTLHSEGSCPPR